MRRMEGIAMNLQFSATGLVLARGQVVRLEGATGTHIVNQGGVVWITQDGDPRDVVLHRGEAFRIDRGTPAIVQAFEPAVISIAEAETAPRRKLDAWAWLRRRDAAGADTLDGLAAA
jgi:hypothetical protein